MKKASVRKCIYCDKPVEEKKIKTPGYVMQNLNFHLDCLTGSPREKLNDQNGDCGHEH